MMVLQRRQIKGARGGERRGGSEEATEGEGVRDTFHIIYGAGTGQYAETHLCSLSLKSKTRTDPSALTDAN